MSKSRKHSVHSTTATMNHMCVYYGKNEKVDTQIW